MRIYILGVSTYLHMQFFVHAFTVVIIMGIVIFTFIGFKSRSLCTFLSILYECILSYKNLSLLFVDIVFCAYLESLYYYSVLTDWGICCVI